MNYQPARTIAAHNRLSSLLLRVALALLFLMAWFTITANAQDRPKDPVARSPIAATHVLGFESVPRNVSGELSIVDQQLRFEGKRNASAQVGIVSIQNISLGEQDKQVGGVPMMLGKAAVPFGGGRVVSLFSHKKYDTVGIEYLDSRGGLHGLVLRLPKGQGDVLKNSLLESGANISRPEDQVVAQSTPEQSLDAGKWSLQVVRVDPGDTTLDHCFADAIYENLLRELNKSKQFENVFRSGDRNASEAPRLLVLKTLVQKYSQGSETLRAVTTIAGATKLKIQIQLVTQDGRVVLNSAASGNVRFIGDNLRATHKLANNTAKLLKRSLPQPAALALPQGTAADTSPAFPERVRLDRALTAPARDIQ